MLIWLVLTYNYTEGFEVASIDYLVRLGLSTCCLHIVKYWPPITPYLLATSLMENLGKTIHANNLGKITRYELGTVIGCLCTESFSLYGMVSGLFVYNVVNIL